MGCRAVCPDKFNLSVLFFSLPFISMFSTSELIDFGAIKQWDSFLTEAIVKGLKGRQLRNAIPHRRMTATIYKNYPQGEMTITDFLLGQYYLYGDSLNAQEWNMENDSTKMVLGHECQKATCCFRGRQWTAWFALDVPVSDFISVVYLYEHFDLCPASHLVG